ncbi:MAG: hypothetical protein ACKV2Q_23685 [Planctomycetaceae bacterium]
MSATLPNSDLSDTNPAAIWSRGGGSFRRLVWKEMNEAFNVWGAIAFVTVCSAALVNRQAIKSAPALLLHAGPALFALIYGARAFAQEFSGGTWELLKSVGASARDVVWSKWLVGVGGSVLMSGLSISLAANLRLPLRIAELGEPTLWYLLVVLLTLAVSLLVSQWSRSVWSALALSGVLCLPLWALWATGFDQFDWLTMEYRWQCNAALSLVLVDLPVVLALQIRTARWNLLDQFGLTGSQRWWRVFWRMAWKELMAARDFWLAVLGIVALLDGLAWLMFRDTQTRDSTIVVIAILLPLLHALGCGAISFAIEREDGTHDWLRRISAPADAVLAAKLAVSQLSIVTLTSLVLLTTLGLVGTDLPLNGKPGFGLLLAVTMTGVISLGASMLTRRVLPAVFLAFVACAGVVAITSTLLAMTVWAIDHNHSRPLGAEGLMPWWLLLGMSLLVIECWLAERWLNERPWWKKVWRGDAAKKLVSRRDVAWFEQSPSAGMRAFGRLLWREWREARYWLCLLPIGFAPWLMMEVSESYIARHGGYVPSIVHSLVMGLLSILSIMLTVLPTLWGVWAFHHDQRQGLFRFLSDRGSSPTGIWLSKHSVWLPQVLLLALLAGGTLGLHQPTWHWQAVGFALVGALQGYAAGQCLAQLIRSPLTSLFLASVLSALLAGWSWLLWEIHAPFVYQFVPAATLLLTSWVHSRDWLEDRRTARAWLKIGCAVLLPLAELVLLLAVQGYPLWKTLRDWPAFR